jgi:hypothetical protein
VTPIRRASPGGDYFPQPQSSNESGGGKAATLPPPVRGGGAGKVPAALLGEASYAAPKVNVVPLTLRVRRIAASGLPPAKPAVTPMPVMTSVPCAATTVAHGC